ncbi:MAG: hypothetical protein K6G00_01535 [Treponema sp.]|nr:hypothetical protein [Treponema sp.]
MRRILLIIALFIIFGIISICYLYTRKPLKFTPDAAYLWPEETHLHGEWLYETLPTGHSYFLYLPEKYRNDRDNESATLPLIVTFHGSCEKGTAVSKLGVQFTKPDFQKKIFQNGAAVLVVLSRVEYFTDPHSMSLLIQNIVLRNKCIDKTNIIGYGFSQGAKFVVELACAEPRLFRGVISGSGFYIISYKELLTVLPVSFYLALSENDSGIFEQGVKTGKLCGRWCHNSRYVQYKTRYHFLVTLKDKTEKNNETMEDWLISVVNE